MPLYKGEYEDVLMPFLDGMRMKMANSKRFHGTRTWETTDTAKLLDGLRAELQELEEAITSGSRLEAILEAFDVANMAMMLADRLGLPRYDPPVKPNALPGSVPLPPICPHGYASPWYCPECKGKV